MSDMLSARYIILLASLLFLGSACNKDARRQSTPTDKWTVSRSYVSGDFPLVHDEQATPIITDSTDAQVVTVVARALSGDIADITGVHPDVLHDLNKSPDKAIIVGTLGESALIDQIVDEGKFDADSIRGKWETFKIGVVDQPLNGVDQALVIAGSDRRGTAYGMFELSRRMGVSPWKWWADVHPEPANELYVSHNTMVVGPPSVKYRGVFLNDEDWGLQPWAAKNIDTDVKDIGPKTYAHIFELLLRLKANFIWPAMHPSTRAFWYYNKNPKVADKYAIVVGSSHAEPMLRNNVFEWREHFKEEYGEEHGPWRYDKNKQQIYRYWEDRVRESAPYENVYTIGMRGVHDSGMPGPKSQEGKIKLLEQVIHDQRGLLKKYIDKPIEEIPQIFCPYKEVLDLYRGGLKLPDDVTIVWADDNHGYIRQLSTPKEQQRSGGSGVYYHLSYWGDPHDYLWLSSTSPSLISYEMSKAYAYGAQDLWVFNVGDIKPAEMNLSFAMDLAWNVDDWKPQEAPSYAKHWARETFGAQYASEIAKIKNEYYQLAQAGKPEHLGTISFDSVQTVNRLQRYDAIRHKAEKLYAQMPDRLKDAFFELILYPVKSASLMNKKILYARKSMRLARSGDEQALDYAQQARDAFAEIKQLTETYNKDIAGGKWDGMMSWQPRDLEVYFMPEVATKQMLGNAQEHTSQNASANLISDHIPADHLSIAVNDFKAKHDSQSASITFIPDLGIEGGGLTIMPISAPSVSADNITNAPYIDYRAKLAPGSHTVYVKGLPTHHINAERKLRYAVSVNGNEPQIVNLQTKSKTEQWRANVLRGFSMGKTTINVSDQGDESSTIRIYMPDPGLVINQIEISK